MWLGGHPTSGTLRPPIECQSVRLPTLANVLHACFTCDPGPEQVVDHDRQVVHVPPRFRGPPASANGGVAAGLYACLGAVALGAPVGRLNVRLHVPPPLEVDLPYRFESTTDERVDVTVEHPATGEPVLSGWVKAEREVVMDPETAAELAAHASPTAAQLARFDDHVEPSSPAEASFGGCFVCGPDAEGGLQLRLRPITDEIRWLPWQPDAHWLDRGGLAELPAIAALDCTAALGLNDRGFLAPDEACLLGTYDAEVIERPTGDNAHDLRIVTKARGREGRKVLTDIGLFNGEGRPMVLGLGTWIVVSPEVAAGG